MEMASGNQENGGFFSRGCCWFKTLWEKIVSKTVEAARSMRSLGQEDPRRIVHSVKVGLAIALVSLIYYFDPIYEGFGVSAMWAVITVVVVFEFSVGATFGRCLNRGIATLLGGALGVADHRLASCFGIETLEPIILASSVFLFAAIVTFVRFFPKLKARYDYGLLIFILTFCLISVSGYQDDEVLDIALSRLSTILIGASASLAICILLFPVWAGEDLHHLVANNIEKLGNFLEGFEVEYFKELGDENAKDNKALLEAYKTVVNSKTIEDSLVNAAKWEPRHGRFKYRHPWGQYQKIGSLTRECSYRLDTLNSYLKTEMQTPQEIREKFQESCKKMSSESSQAMKKLALAIRTMTSSSTIKSHVVNAKKAADDFKLLLKTNPCHQNNLLDIIPVATVASLLIEVVCCTDKISESVHELASLAKFKTSSDDDALKSDEAKNTGRVTRSPSPEVSHSVVISVE